MELFSMFLSGAISWGIGKILDIIFYCNTCSEPNDENIGNKQSNFLECSNCHKVIEQYTNACDFTIDKSTKQIGHGIFAPKDYLWLWTCGDGLFDFSNNFLQIPYQHRIEGMKDRSVIFEAIFRKYDNDVVIKTFQDVLYCTYESSYFDYSIRTHKDTFKDEHKGIISVDARIMSDYRDVLYDNRRIIKPWNN